MKNIGIGKRHKLIGSAEEKGHFDELLKEVESICKIDGSQHQLKV